MTSDVTKTFGFELLYKVCGFQVTKREDVLILVVHWYLIRNGFKCLSLGDCKIIGSAETSSELLPDNWNHAENYMLRYVREKKLYILMGTISETDLLLNLLRVQDHNVSNVEFSTNIVKELKGPIEILLPTYETVINSLKQNLVEPIDSENRREMSTQTIDVESERSDRDDDPLRVGPSQQPGAYIMTGVGRNDLDPFGIGGGMLFDPFPNRRLVRPPFGGLGNPSRLPIGAVPPGSRFDPFGPPDNDASNRTVRMPNSDYRTSPNYDMFM